jgi:hypothetical protein
MIGKDIEDDFDSKLNFAEYIASFINPEAVSKIKSAREATKDKRFMDNIEFENMIKNKDFLKVEYNKTNNDNDSNIVEERKGARDIRLPKEISGILKLNRDNF